MTADSSSDNTSPNRVSSTGPLPGTGLVHFEGPWTAEEVARLEHAAGVAEAADLPALPPHLGRPWVATKHVFPSFTLCTASRPRATPTITAPDAAALAARIEALGEGDTAHFVFQLVYQSEATRPMDGAALRELLRQARDKNHRLGVTGVLLYKAEGFLQVLEGDEQSVRTLYATIREDLRHDDVETLLTTQAPRRVFPGWSMGLDNLDAVAADEPGVTSFLQSGRLPADRNPVPEVVRALEQFKGR